CYGQQVLRDFELFVENQADFAVDRENQEGVRGNVSGQYGSGWFLLRLSLHEPLLVLQVENDQSDKNACVIEKIATFLQKYEEIDSQQIENNLGN
ncbi:phosphomannomutase/phosphoglucomutase, partial [Enterococcus faecalis]|nr:phosphomannomutase/phosphoglucomutase [Enterococcus faecalis]